MNRRGFLASLAALALAPKLAPAAPSLPVPALALVDGPLPLTGLAGWLPVACVVASPFCPPDRLYIIGNETKMSWRNDGIDFFGLDRGKPVIIAHPDHVDELRDAIDQAVGRVTRAAERDMFGPV